MGSGLSVIVNKSFSNVTDDTYSLLVTPGTHFRETQTRLGTISTLLPLLLLLLLIVNNWYGDTI